MEKFAKVRAARAARLFFHSQLLFHCFQTLSKSKSILVFKRNTFHVCERTQKVLLKLPASVKFYVSFLGDQFLESRAFTPMHRISHFSASLSLGSFSINDGNGSDNAVN